MRTNKETPARKAIVVLHPDDNIAVITRALKAGEVLLVNGEAITIARNIPMGHKISLRPIHKGEKVMKHGAPIGSALCPIEPGEHVHMQNLASDYIPAHQRGSSGLSDSGTS